MFGRSRQSDDQPAHEPGEGPLARQSQESEPVAPPLLQQVVTDHNTDPASTPGNEPAEQEGPKGPAAEELIEHIEDELARLREVATEQAEADRRANLRVTEAQALAEEAQEALELEQQAHERSRTDAAQSIAKLGESITALESQSEELEARASKLEAERDELRTQAAATPTAPDAETTERLAALEAREHELSSELARARRSLVEAGAHISQLKRQCAEAERTQSANTGVDEFNARRRERLADVRTALQARGQQMLQVKHALERKAQQLKDAETARSQSEQLLFEARERRSAAEQVYQRLAEQKAKGGTGAFVGLVAFAWVMVVAGAWFGVDRFVPTEHEASITLEADLRGTENPDEAAALWTAFALALPEDPQFLEFASRRLKARAYDAYDSPAVLRTELAEHSLWTSNAPGNLIIHMNEVGQERSARILDALGTAIVAYANDTRTRRADASPAAIIVPANADPTPVNDTRLAIFGVVAGALTALLLACTVFAWRNMRRTILESTRETFVHAEAAHENALTGEHEDV